MFYLLKLHENKYKIVKCHVQIPMLFKLAYYLEVKRLPVVLCMHEYIVRNTRISVMFVR